MNERIQMLQDVYVALADLWCSPQDVDSKEARKVAGEQFSRWESTDAEAAGLLSRFLEDSIAEEDYVDLFELDPQCPLYLGSHSFDEPQTCPGAGMSDRNGYMLELLAIYRHLGLMPNMGELPDYLPLMVEFLALSAESEDPIREKLIEEYVLPYLPPMRSKLEELKTPYLYLLDALERMLKLDMAAGKKVASHG
jgi:nitrate reductase molybdenum cofactor assembly chaperone